MRSSEQIRALLRCVECLDRPPVAPVGDGDRLRCPVGHEFSVVDGVPRMLRRTLRDRVAAEGAADAALDIKRRTAASFGYEWRHFAEMRPQWEQNFLAYMAPKGHEWFSGRLVLDAGAGTGRHAYYAARDGADVVAVDIGPAIEVARRNTAELPNVLAVQADLYELPFADGTFDFVYSIGVLHHLPDPPAALRELLRVLRPGGDVTIYLYAKPGPGLRRALLWLISAMRTITTRLPHPVLHRLAYPIAAVAWLVFVLPTRLLALVPRTRSFAASMPLAAYADYPFGVCANDQFDRFSAPIERRYTADEMREWLARAGLTDVDVRRTYGWVASGRKPAASDRHPAS